MTTEPIETITAALARSRGVPVSDISVAVVPYRVCPIGAHSDHQGGPVLGTAVNAHTLLAFAPSGGRDIAIVSENFEGDVRFDLGEGATPDGWGRYAVAAARALEDRLPRKPRGIVARVAGGLPEAGLSSSASVILAYVTALAEVNEIELSPKDRVRIAYRAEREFVGVQVGVLDPAAIVGSRKDHLLNIDTAALGWEALPLPAGAPAPAFVVVFSGLERNLPGTGYNRRVEECGEAARKLGARVGRADVTRLGELPEDVFDDHAATLEPAEARRARHFFSERKRVLEGAAAWRAGDLDGFGELMNASCESSIENWEAGSPEIIAIQELLLATEGVLGSRFSGAGFGGSVVALVRRNDAPAVAREVERRLPRALSRGRARVLVLESDNGITVR